MSAYDDALRHEGAHAYGSAAEQLPQEQFVAAAQEVLGRLSAEQRKGLVEAMRANARRQDVNYPGLHEVNGLDGPQALGGLFGHIRFNAPGLLEQLLEDTELYETVLGGMDAIARRG